MDNKGRLPATDYKIVNVSGANLAQDAYLYLNRYVVPPGNPCYTYGYNQTMLADFTCPTRTDAGNNLVWATEAAGGGGGQRWVTSGMLVPTCTNLSAYTIKPHGDKNNFLYLDGHVATQPFSAVVKADFTRGTPAYKAADDTLRMAN